METGAVGGYNDDRGIRLQLVKLLKEVVSSFWLERKSEVHGDWWDCYQVELVGWQKDAEVDKEQW